MIKKSALVLILLVLVLAFSGISAVQAGSNLSIVSSSVETDFPASLTFNISARSDANITDIRLSYQVERLEHARVVSEIFLPVSPATSVTTQWVWDMRMTGGLPAGSGVDYWWTVSDAAGNKLETVPERVFIEDSRYSWKSITEGDVTLYWYRGDDSFAGELMEATQEALTQLKANTGAELERPVSLYIYANSSDLQGAMIFAQEWTGGVAFTQYGIIAIGIGTSAGEVAWGNRTIPHELTHLVIHQVVFNPYNDLPTWLDEGLAMNAEGALDTQFTSSLSSARSRGSLISLRSLSSPFSAYADQSILAYAESYEAVTYLIDNYGREKMFDLLQAFRKGSGYDQALKGVYGFDMDGLDSLWRASPAAVPVP
ncbi:MAG: hypothetical protein A2Z29_03175 [Chloroflexi bacterium RBG_16_56_11]|nr:MAG: hypothetical protein A2Z29_03175 [Chloroflexi bacterium RBG_16_56_11]